MLLHDSRRTARLRDGELVLLADQDRTLWDRERIDAGRAALERALALRAGTVDGLYTLQATIASLHVEGTCDWPRIAALYGRAGSLDGLPVVELNRAVALAETGGPERACEDRAVAGARRLPLFPRRPRRSVASSWAVGRGSCGIQRALELVHSEPERRFLERRLAEFQHA